LALKATNRYQNGNVKAGFMTRTHVTGFSGIADIIWGAAYRIPMPHRSNAGAPFPAMQARSKQTVTPVMCFTVPAKGKHFYNGAMIHLFRGLVIRPLGSVSWKYHSEEIMYPYLTL
jgi:hypothetical protein